MKKELLLILIAVTALFTSCASTSYYQVYETAPSEELTKDDNALFYEDENCKVSYNLWDDGGNMGFRFYNKTDENIYLNLGESFFILNGLSYDYYKNRIFTNSSSSGTSASQGASASKSATGFNVWNLLQTNGLSASRTVGNMASSGSAVSYNEEKIVVIPSHTSKIISEYSINERLYRDCDLFKYPRKREIRSKSFSKANSPFVFSNRIAYSVGDSEDLVKFENEFYVTEITNFPEKEIVETRHEEFCDQKNHTESKFFKDVSPDKFYIHYTKSKEDYWEH